MKRPVEFFAYIAMMDSGTIWLRSHVNGPILRFPLVDVERFYADPTTGSPNRFRFAIHSDKVEQFSQMIPPPGHFSSPDQPGVTDSAKPAPDHTVAVGASTKPIPMPPRGGSPDLSLADIMREIDSNPKE